MLSTGNLTGVKLKLAFGGCSLTDSIAIEVYAAQTGVNLGKDTMHCPGKTITIKAGKKFRTYLWQDGSSKDSLVAAQPGSYNITATDSCGNIFKDTLLIKPFDVVLKADYPKPICIPDYIYWPTAFTPDNNGRNDTYKPSINGQLVLYEFIIYNRYGQAVFKTSNPTQGWDGRFKNIKNPLSGGYVWSCKYQFAGRLLQQEQGTFVLIR